MGSKLRSGAMTNTARRRYDHETMTTTQVSVEDRARWRAFMVLCLGSFMIVLDTTIVNVALPSIRTDLGFSEGSLAWVVNAYMLFFGGFLLLGGRLADLYGHRRLFATGIAVFTAASLVAGLSSAQAILIAARALQGLGGAVTVTASLMLAVYAIVNGNEAGWTSAQTVGLTAAAIAIFAAFVAIESRVADPLMPLGLFRRRNLATANVMGVLWAAAMFAWFFLSALYLQLVLGYSPLKVGLSFLPANLIMGTFSLGLSAKLVMRFGLRKPLGTGLLLAAAGLVLFARAPVHGNFVVDVLPSMILLGFGAGMAFNPVLLAAMSDVEPEESGLASGVVNTAFMMGGALGLAVLASLADHRTHTLSASGHSTLEALTGGYHAAFLVGAVSA